MPEIRTAVDQHWERGEVLDLQKELDEVLNTCPENFFDLLEKAAKSGQAAEVVDRISSLDPSIQEENYFKLLLICAQQGQSEAVFELIGKLEWESASGVLEKILNTCIENGQSGVVLKFLEDKGVSWRDCNQLYMFCTEKGQAEEVFGKLKDVEWDLTDRATRFTLKNCIRGGQAEAVMDGLQEKEIDLKEVYFLLHLCAVFGAEDRVFDLIKDMDWDLNDPKFLTILIACVEKGKDKEVVDKIKDLEWDIENRRITDLLSRCVLEGQADEVMAMLTDGGIEINDIKEQRLINVLAASSQAEVIFNELQKTGIDLIERINFLNKCVEAGKAEVVMNLIINESWDLSDNKFLSLLIKCVEGGQARVVTEELMKMSWDLKKNLFLELLRVCTKNGMAEEVGKELKEKEAELDVKNEKIFDLLITLEVYGFSGFEELLFSEEAGYSEEEIEAAEEKIKSIWEELAKETKGEIPDLAKGGNLDKYLVEFIDGLSYQGLKFFNLIIEGEGLLSSKVLEIISRARKDKSWVASVHKSGSELRIFYKEGLITFVNDIKSSAAEMWQQAVDLKISVAPILKSTQRGEGKTRVYSRYVGLSVREVKDVIGGKSPLWRIIVRKRAEIMKSIHINEITHGHPHGGNFTVEFVRKDYLDQQGKDFNVNEVPCDPGVLSFNPVDYMKNPDEWEVVVRLIDWDSARSKEVDA